jgi:hypothetical protein
MIARLESIANKARAKNVLGDRYVRKLACHLLILVHPVIIRIIQTLLSATFALLELIVICIILWFLLDVGKDGCANLMECTLLCNFALLAPSVLSLFQLI